MSVMPKVDADLAQMPPRGALVSVAALALCTLVACTNGSTGEKKPAPPPTPDASSAAPASPAKVPDAPRLTEFPAISLDGLGAAERQAFVEIVNEEVCPCDCPRSFAACLQADTRCQPAVILAEWLVGQLAEGVQPEMLAEQVAQEIGGFSSKAKTLNVAGYATKGSKAPQIQIVEFADFECGHCKAVAPVLDEIVRTQGDKVQVVYKHFPLSFHPMAQLAAQAAEAAGLQGRFWEMHEAVFATQTMLDEALLLGHAKAIGLDIKKFEADWKSDAIVAKVADSRKEGESIGVEATPTLMINGRPFNLMRTPEGFAARFAMEAARASSSCN